MARARFITFEGVDGAGKSTQLAGVAELLLKLGLPHIVTREPGGTPLGEQLRDVLLHSGKNIHPETETLLMFAARREHIDKIIAPALHKGMTVLCDRFSDASFAYQGGGSGVSTAKLDILERWVHADLQPDLTLYFDLPVEIARQRIDALRPADRFERESGVFFERVRAAYLARARANPHRIRVINADATPESINKQLENIVLSLWP